MALIFCHISQTLNTSIQQQLERVVRKEMHAALEKMGKDVSTSLEGAILRSTQDTLKKSLQSMPKGDTLFKDALDKTLPQMRYETDDCN